MDSIITLEELKKAPIAHTDTGDYLFLGTPQNEFYVKGKITKIRAGLLFLEIEGEKFTTHKREGFESGEEVICIINPKIEKENIEFIVRSVEKVN
jgi:hypothetical protein